VEGKNKMMDLEDAVSQIIRPTVRQGVVEQKFPTHIQGAAIRIKLTAAGIVTDQRCLTTLEVAVSRHKWTVLTTVEEYTLMTILPHPYVVWTLILVVMEFVLESIELLTIPKAISSVV